MTIKDFFDIGIRRIIRKSAHRNTFGKSYLAACECEVKFFRDCSCVLAHNFVKVAQAQQYHGLRIGFLHIKILTINRTYGNLIALFG